ncbi:MAG: hypothetical protein ACI9DK_001792 [Vicingaceae bacterium]
MFYLVYFSKVKIFLVIKKQANVKLVLLILLNYLHLSLIYKKKKMKKFLTLFVVAALFSAVACGDAKKDASNVEEEAKVMMDDMNSAMEEVTETAVDSTDGAMEAGEEVMEEGAEAVEVAVDSVKAEAVDAVK